MNLFQIIMLLVAAYFAYKVYGHIHTLEDVQETKHRVNDVGELVQSSDKAFLDGQYEKAALSLKEAYEQNQYDPEILAKLGYVMAVQGYNQQALEYYNKALQIEPDNAPLYNKTASVYRNLKTYDKAKELLERSIALDATNKVTYFNYGNLLMDMNDKDKALEMYRAALKIDPNFKEAQEEIKYIDEVKN